MLSGPWQLPGRFRRVSVIHVSATFLSRFPLRFRCVSVPLRFRRASACPTEATPQNSPSNVVLPSAGGRADLKPNLLWRSGSDLVSYAAVSGSRGATFSGASSDMLPIAASLGVRCDAGPRVTSGSRWFECVSTFPSRFR